MSNDDFISNSNLNIEEEDLKFKNSINMQKRKTADFSNKFKINLEKNISFNESEINDSKIIINSSIITQPGLDNKKEQINVSK